MGLRPLFLFGINTMERPTSLDLAEWFKYADHLEQELARLTARSNAKLKASDLAVVADVGFPATAERVANTLQEAESWKKKYEWIRGYYTGGGQYESASEETNSLLEAGTIYNDPKAFDQAVDFEISTK